MSERYDLEERLLEYAARIIRLVEKLPATRAGNHVVGQLLRSGTSALPNHGECAGGGIAQGFCPQTQNLSQGVAGITAVVAFDSTGAIAQAGTSAAVGRRNGGIGPDICRKLAYSTAAQ